MTPDTIFAVANTLALLSWVVLIALPRWPHLMNAIRHGTIGALSLVYAMLVMVYFFKVPGGGFGSIAQVRALFASDHMLVAGWVHYLAFDLFVGLWIAERARQIGLSRLLQAPILVATFMFGPLGLILFTGCQMVAGIRAPKELTA